MPNYRSTSVHTYRGHHIPWRKKKEKKREVPGLYYVPLYKHQRRRQLAARGHCHSTTAISAFTRRPAAEGKLLLRVYLPRPVVGHRVAQATALPSGGGAEAPFGVVAVACVNVAGPGWASPEKRSRPAHGWKGRPRSWQGSARWYQAFFFFIAGTRRSLVPYTTPCQMRHTR